MLRRCSQLQNIVRRETGGARWQLFPDRVQKRPMEYKTSRLLVLSPRRSTPPLSVGMQDDTDNTPKPGFLILEQFGFGSAVECVRLSLIENSFLSLTDCISAQLGYHPPRMG